MKNFKRKNRKIKYNEQKYIESNYIVDGKAIIPIELNDVSELFMKHDYKQFELSDDICKYIEEIAYMIPIDIDIILDIHCPKVNDQTKRKMEKAIKNNYGMDIDDAEYDIRRINNRSILFGIIGLLLLIFNILTEKSIGQVFSNFICVVWWVAIWETVELQTIEKMDLKWKRLNYQQLYDAQIEFTFDKENKKIH